MSFPHLNKKCLSRRRAIFHCFLLLLLLGVSLSIIILKSDNTQARKLYDFASAKENNRNVDQFRLSAGITNNTFDLDQDTETGQENRIVRDRPLLTSAPNTSLVKTATDAEDKQSDARLRSFWSRMTARQRFLCSESAARQEIRNLCQLYENGVVTGDLCSPLCRTGLVSFTGCGYQGKQKKVLTVNCTDVCEKGSTVMAVLKTAVDNVTSDIEDLYKWQPATNSSRDQIQASRHLVMWYTNMYIRFHVFRESDALKVMWGQGTEQDMQLVKYASAVWRSLSLLLPQTEYVLAKAFQDTRVFPRIYGSCGHFYIQESCPSLGPLSISSSFVERAKFALGTLHFLQRVETNMPDHPIMCDLKLSNLGVCSNGEIRSTDSNSFIFESTVPDVGCSRNSHCNFGTYCKFTCNVKQGKCVKGDNINLQMVCSHVLAFPGGKIARLSHDPPPAVAADLKHVLSECVALQPGEERRIMEQLKTVFNRSLLLLENGRQ